MPARPPFNRLTLLKVIEAYPVIWDVNHKKFNDRYCQAAAWKDVACKLKTEERILKNAWKCLCDIYKRELNKCSHPTQEYKGRWKYFHIMSFLRENYLTDNEYEINEDKDDNYPIEFIIENDSCSDSEEDSHSVGSIHTFDSSFVKQEPTFTETTQEPTTRKRKRKSDTTAESCFSGKREYSYSDFENTIPVTHNIKESDYSNMNNDVMFLKSLAPYFKLLDPMRKLVMRSRIQDLLLKEIDDQDLCRINKLPS